jgi:hypothetical protein
MARKVVNKDHNQSTELGPFFVSVRGTKHDETGKPRFVVLSLHGAESLNAKDAYHFALYPEKAEQLADALLDIALGPETDDAAGD